MIAISRTWKRLLAFLAVAIFAIGTPSAQALGMSKIDHNPWEVVTMPTDLSLLDVAFTSDPNHGWVVGVDSMLLETTDGGSTWQQRELLLGEQKYRFSAIDFEGDEGWVAGQPAILLHTADAGESWEQIPLSERLPGAPQEVVALGDETAEMVTELGAIYRTEDSGRNWKAMVNDAFGVLKSLHRSADGNYVAVSSRGNFYSIWRPGQDSWENHNRSSSRRLQTMGFAPDGRLWLLARGGVVQLSNTSDPEDWAKAQQPENLNSWGFLDAAFRTNDEAWIVGGSGTLLASFDGGQSWQNDADVEDIPANFYKIKFLDEGRGYVLGQRGTFLRYVG
ncbi:photosynthesis system II assembly factor Ycf48 [filamentous cyanobacterium LEGE 11480]|uniref:Photosystem II assembly protein Ycf48 n=1 Tax=Romeriopsis navalis LEGE 11480 TaxID=2777977 RepID=A0A928Z5X3_9CYAN|nr:photosynthesis system II assembly factor Ycf48 [Romeriopsis navalis]MBE9033244.1 photosynthesis system II assembly factor Ycf48 [Romeriopsis navalis LEGE 11480]